MRSTCSQLAAGKRLLVWAPAHAGGIRCAEDVEPFDAVEQRVQLVDEIVARLKRPAAGAGDAAMADVVERARRGGPGELVLSVGERDHAGEQRLVEAELPLETCFNALDAQSCETKAEAEARAQAAAAGSSAPQRELPPACALLTNPSAECGSSQKR
jgi:hypothetical protein